jgi:filamentous hemagglutinin family protein
MDTMMTPRFRADTIPRGRKQLRLLSTCAMAISLAAVLPGAARAQVHAVQGAGTVAAGSATIDSVGGTLAAPLTNVTVSSQTAVINWAPTDTDPVVTSAIDFLPANGRLSFSSTGDFTVLNRILTPTDRAIGINGAVDATLGGNVWFYSPTGIVAGSGASFRANGVVLTANDIPYTAGPSGGIDFGPNGEIQFTAASGSKASVTMLPGSLIANTGNQAYTLLVAPSITQAGTIQLDGSVGLVAAEQATVIVQTSLFDIEVQVGTSVVNAITHSGSTGGTPTGPAVTGPQNVVIVATPQNTAITVLLSGDLGATAVNATAADRAVIISGGYDYNDLSSVGLANFSAAAPVNLQIGSANFNAETIAHTTGSIAVSPSRGEAITFGENAALTADLAVTVAADLDESITALQDLALTGGTAALLRLGTTNGQAGGGAAAATIAVLGDLTVSASNIGSPLGNDGFGGFATVQLDAGGPAPTLTVGGATLIAADGVGRYASGNGGSGFGGSAQLLVNGGTAALNDTTITANGIGADDIAGGDGAGGVARIVATSGTITLGELLLSADGQGGLGGIAVGAGQGGIAMLDLGVAALTVLGGSITANGQGASGSGAVRGASGTGGEATFTATGATGYSLSDLAVLANGTAGNSTGAATPSDGVGTGGVARFGNAGAAGAGARSVGALLIQANGDGGLVGGNPGIQAVGGLAQFADIATGASGHAGYTSVGLQAQGVTAPAGKGASIASGGAALALGQSFDVDSAGNVTVAVDGGGTITSDALTIFSTLGDIVISHTNRASPATFTMLGETVLIDASGNLTAGPNTRIGASDALLLRARTGNIAVNDLYAANEIGVHALGNVALHDAITDGPFIELSGSLVGGSIDITAGVDPVELVGTYLPVDIVVSGTVSASGQLQAHAGRDIRDDGASPQALLSGERVTLLGERDISGANLSITSRRDLNLLIGRNLRADAVDVGGVINMISLLETIVQPTRLAVTGSLAVAELTLRGPTPGFVRAGGDLTIGMARTTALDVASDSGLLTLSGLSGYPNGASQDLVAAAPSVALSGIQVANSVTATSTAGNLSANAITAGGAVTFDSAGGITVGGPIVGQTITAVSTDFAIGAAGRLGAPGVTRFVELTNGGVPRTFYGGADTTAGYSLSGAEIGRIYADDITLIAPTSQSSSTANPDVVVGGFTVSGRASNPNGQLGPEGAFTIRTAGRVLINGAVSFSGLNSANRFVLRAGNQIALDNQLGLVDLRGVGTTLAGTIDFSASGIVVASSAVQQALASLTDAAAINALLDVNDGAIRPQGALRAGGMTFNVQTGLFIQNTGLGTVTAQRRGFAVGDGGLTIRGADSGAPLIVINGAARSLNSSAIGVDTIPFVRINGQPAANSTGFRQGSTINGCDFTNVQSCAPTPPQLSPVGESEITPTLDRIAERVSPHDATVDGLLGRQTMITTAIELTDFGRLAYKPLIDEPVTGSGNDDLWTPSCDSAPDGTCTGPSEKDDEAP